MLGRRDFCRMGRSLYSTQAFSLSSLRCLSFTLLLCLTLPLTRAVVSHDGQVHRRRVRPEVCDAERGQPRLELADLVRNLSLPSGSFTLTPQGSLEAILEGIYHVSVHCSSCIVSTPHRNCVFLPSCLLLTGLLAGLPSSSRGRDLFQGGWRLEL